MKEIQVADKGIQLDDQGFLVNQEDWNRDVARAIAKETGVGELNDEQIEIIEFLRTYYHKFKAFPILNYQNGCGVCSIWWIGRCSIFRPFS